MTQLDELRAIEMKALDVEPAARSEPDEPAVDRFLDVYAEIVPLRPKEPQAVRCILRGGIVTLEPVARGASVDQVLDIVGATRYLRQVVIDLELTTHRRLGHAAITASATESCAHGRARFCRNGHLCGRQRAARNPGKSGENGGAAPVELGEEAARVGNQGVLLRHEPSQLLVLAFDLAELVIQVPDFGA